MSFLCLSFQLKSSIISIFSVQGLCSVQWSCGLLKVMTNFLKESGLILHGILQTHDLLSLLSNLH